MVYQVFNKRIGAWVKIKVVGKKHKITNVKEENPSRPFKGIKKK